MMVCGEGINPTRQHILQLAKNAGIKVRDADNIIDEVLSGVSQWEKLSKSQGLSTKSKDYISQRIKSNIQRLK